MLCNPVAKQTPIRTVYELYDLGQDPYEIRDRWVLARAGDKGALHGTRCTAFHTPAYP